MLDPPLIGSWASCKDVGDRALCFAKQQSCVNFFYLEKANLQYRSGFERNERRTRLATRYTVSYPFVTQNNISGAKGMFSYAKLTVGQSQIEVPIG